MNRFPIFLPILLLFVGLTAVPIAQAAGNSRMLYDKIDPILVSVEYKAEMTFMGQTEDIEGRVMGLAVEPQGTIIFDGTSLGTGAHSASDMFKNRNR